MESLIKYFESGGIIILILVIISVAIWLLSLRSYAVLREQLTESDFDQCYQTPAEIGASSRMIKQLKESQNVSETAEFCYDCELTYHTGSFKILGALVAVAPLLGLLGTVIGMIETFDTIAGLGNVDGLISLGISKALITTQAGLAVALPGSLVFVHLVRMRDRLKHLLQQVESRFTILMEEKTK